MHIVRASSEAALQAIIADLKELIRRADAAGHSLLAFMLEQAKLEAENQLRTIMS